MNLRAVGQHDRPYAARSGRGVGACVRGELDVVAMTAAVDPSLHRNKAQ